MKTREQLLPEAKARFEQYPDQDVFFCTPDGMFFNQHNRPEGVNYATATGMELYTIERNDTIEPVVEPVV